MAGRCPEAFPKQATPRRTCRSSSNDDDDESGEEAVGEDWPRGLCWSR